MLLRFGPTVCLVFALASVTGGAVAAERTQVAAPTAAATSAQLASQARYWEQKGRYDLAREAWLKLLRVAPDNPTALAGMATAEILGGRPEMARQYLQGLRQIQPDHPDLARIENMLATGARPGDAPGGLAAGELSRARELARTGRYDESTAEYRRIFGGTAPTGPLALEYWQTLAGAEGGWVEARAGLETLVKSNPDNPDFGVALAQHLTYREETRRQGLDQLMQLAEADAARQPVQPIWRQALLWMSGGGGDARYFQAYLRRYGEDTQVSSRLAAGRHGKGHSGPTRPYRLDQRSRALRDAWALLDAGKLEQAEQAFLAMNRKDGRDYEALGALGIIRLRQDRLGEARQLLERASKGSKRRARRWSGPLATARFWEQMRLADAERAAGRPAAAERRIRAAAKVAPTRAAQDSGVAVSLADAMLAQGRVAEAEALYRKVLAREPGHVDAARGLVSALASSGRVGDALVLHRQFSPEQQTEIGTVASLQSLALRQQAAQALALNDASGAERLLKEALNTDPEGTWPRLDLARLYLLQNRRDEARGVIEGLPADGEQRGEASYIRALMAAEEQNWYDGLMWLEQVPQEQRSVAMASTQERLWVRYQAERAAVYARRGQRAEALALLSAIEPRARSAELLGSVASAYVDAGEQTRAMELLRQAITQEEADPHPDLQLAYAGLLLRLDQRAEYDAMVEQLAQRPQRSPLQERLLTDLRIAQRARDADSVRASGDLMRAYETVEPSVREHPGDVRLVMALARVYDQAGEHHRAAPLYRHALKLDPNNLDAHVGAIQAGLATGDDSETQRALRDALRIAPQSGRLHVLAGHLAKSQGRDDRALKFFRRALELGPTSDGLIRGPLQLRYLDQNLQPVRRGGAGNAQGAERGDVSISSAPGRGGRLIKVADSAPEPAAEPVTELPPTPPPRVGKSPVAAAPPVPYTDTDAILREIAEIESRRGTWAAAGVSARHRTGDAGLSQLDDFELPLEFSFTGKYPGRFTLRAVPVQLDAGTLSGVQVPLFGTLALIRGSISQRYKQDDAGIALGAAYKVGDLSVDLGSGPLGFEVPNAVGGISWTPKWRGWSFEADLSRRLVTDSLLSYAGANDPRGGDDFGGVTANGLRLEVAIPVGTFGVYANANSYFYDGKNTADNHSVGVGGGVYRPVYKSARSQVTLGLNLTSFWYDKNLSRYTFGHGGYFSPSRYLSAILPLEWVGGWDRFSWKAHGFIGVQDFHQDEAALFPDDPGLQAAVEAFAINNPAPVITTAYAAQSESGIIGGVGGQIEYLLAPRLVLGARAGFDDAQDFEETRGLVYLRWELSGRNAVAIPPRPLLPFTDYGRKLP